MDNRDKLIEELKKERALLETALKEQRSNCRCSAFCIQYEGGCQCGSEHPAHECEFRIHDLIEKLCEEEGK